MTPLKPATPLPWKYGQLSQNVIGPRGQLIAECVEADFDDAAYIVAACNAYPQLVEDRRRLVEALQATMRAIIPLATGRRFTPERRETVEQARALLAEIGEGK